MINWIFSLRCRKGELLMDLNAHLKNIIALDDLRVITTEVDPQLEVADICRREFATAGGGQALLFNRVKGTKISLVANLFGSESRACKLLHVDSYVSFSTRLQKFLQGRAGTVAERLKLSSAPLITNDEQLPLAEGVKLTGLPALKSWPQEQQGYLSLAMTVSEHPVTGDKNLGLYRAQIIDDQRLALNFSPHSGVAVHLKAAAKMNQPLPISLVLGSDPALIWIAAAPLPEGCDEFAFYQQLFAKELIFTSGITNNLLVPANAEIVIEGIISANDTIKEGPFGNHTGQYVSRADCPVMQVTAIRASANPIVPATVVGPPPSENIFLAKANEILLRQMVILDYPQISDLRMPLETIFHGVTMLAIKPQTVSSNRKLIKDIWQDSPLSRSKLLVLFDEDLDISSLSKCWWGIINRLDLKRIYQDGGRTAFDVTGIDPTSLVEG